MATPSTTTGTQERPDIDIWISRDPENAARVASALRDFGFFQASAETFLEPDTVVRMGVPPMRIEILTTISGLVFADCFPRRAVIEIAGVPVHLIDFQDLKTNKRASGRLKDLADLEQLS